MILFVMNFCHELFIFYEAMASKKNKTQDDMKRIAMKRIPNKSELKIPSLSRDMLETLERAFPERCPRVNDTEREIWMYAGKRDLVRYLWQQLEVTERVGANHPLSL